MEAPWELIRSTEIKKRHQGIRLLLDFLKARQEEEEDVEEDEEEIDELIVLLPDLLLCLRDHNFKIAVMCLEILAMIVRKLPDHVLRNYFKSLWNNLVEKLGDSKLQVREQAVQVVIELTELFGFDAIREKLQPCLVHKNWRTREQVLAFYWRCFEQLDLFETKHKDVIDHVLKALEDSSKDVRDSAMATLTKFYEHLSTPFWQLLETKRIRSAHMRALAERLSGINEEDNGNIRVWQGSNASRSQGSVIISPSRSSSSGGVPPRTTTTRLANFEATDTTKFGANPLDDPSDLSSFGDKLRKNEDWVTRVEALQALRMQTTQLSPDKHTSFSQGIRVIRESLCDQVGDLRSMVAREACETIQTIAKVLVDNFNPHAEFFVASLLKATFVTIQVISTAADECIREIVKSTRNGYPRLINKFIEGARSRNQVLRQCCVSYLIMTFEHWNRNILSKSCEPLVMFLPVGLRDALGEVRAASRKLYWAFRQKFEKEAQDLFDVLDPSIQKALLDDRPPSLTECSQPSQRSASPPPAQPGHFASSSSAAFATSSLISTAAVPVTKPASSTSLNTAATRPGPPARNLIGGKPLRVPVNDNGHYQSHASQSMHPVAIRMLEHMVSEYPSSSSSTASKRRALEVPASSSSSNAPSQGARRLPPPDQRFAFSEDVSELEVTKRRQLGDARRVPAVQSPPMRYTKDPGTLQSRQLLHTNHTALRVFSEDPGVLRSPTKSAYSGATSLPLRLDHGASNNDLNQSVVSAVNNVKSAGSSSSSSRNKTSGGGNGPKRLALSTENDMDEDDDEDMGKTRLHVGALSLQKEKSSIDANMLLAESGLWSARLEALTELATAVGLSESSDESGPVVLELDERVVQTFVKHLSDGHYRVAQVALQNFGKMARRVPNQISQSLKSSLPSLFQRLVDAKEQLRVCATEILDLFMETYDASLLMAQVIPIFAEGSNMKVKVFIGKFLVELLPHSHQYMKQQSGTSHMRVLLTRIAQVTEKDCPVPVATVCGDLVTTLSREFPKELATTVPILPPTKRAAISKILKVRGILLKAPTPTPSQTSTTHPSSEVVKSTPSIVRTASKAEDKQILSSTLAEQEQDQDSPMSASNGSYKSEPDKMLLSEDQRGYARSRAAYDDDQNNLMSPKENEGENPFPVRREENQNELELEQTRMEPTQVDESRVPSGAPLKRTSLKRSRRRSSDEPNGKPMNEKGLALEELVQALRNNNTSWTDRRTVFDQVRRFRNQFMSDNNKDDDYTRNDGFGRICAALIDMANDTNDIGALTCLGSFFLSFPTALGQQYFGPILHQLVDSIDKSADVKAHLIELTLTRMIHHLARVELVLDEVISLVLTTKSLALVVVLRLVRVTLSLHETPPHQSLESILLRNNSSLLVRVANAVAAKLYDDSSRVRKEAVQCLVLLNSASGGSTEFQDVLSRLDLVKQKLVQGFIELQLHHHHHEQATQHHQHSTASSSSNNNNNITTTTTTTTVS